MASKVARSKWMEKRLEHVDVLIVGAGLSGIGSAYHLQKNCPGKSYVILEGRDAIGGTWDLFRYPGIRSDSDMHTLGYIFKPWREAKAIADGPSILNYVKETADENRITDKIRFRHRVLSASWSSDEAAWTVEAERGDAGERVQFSCNMLLMCGGYYNYEKGHDPEFEGVERFKGKVVHPQFWPEDLDYRGKKIVVIGSGATAMTIVPAMAEKGAQVTMLQRSPTYVVSWPDQDALANKLRKYLPEKLAYALTRWKNVKHDVKFYERTRTEPDRVKEELIGLVRQQLPADYDVETHFTPSYNPWDQRLCLITNGDLFREIKKGTVSVETDHIETFTETGLKLKSGKEIEADIIITATGLLLTVMNGVALTVDGKSVNLPDTVAYKGMMYSDVPNLVQTFGYINASWTLRADLTAEFACRLINRMGELGRRIVTPRLRASDKDMKVLPWIDDFSAGYMQRVMHLFPKQGDRDPWRHTQNYAQDKKLIRDAPIDDDVLQFTNPEAKPENVAPRQYAAAR
jgi:cation diffusion facilitator CzcD-associated flavoprotein CzcO